MAVYAKPFTEKLVKCFDIKSRNVNKGFSFKGQKIDSTNYRNKFYAYITTIWKNVSKENKSLRGCNSSILIQNNSKNIFFITRLKINNTKF